MGYPIIRTVWAIETDSGLLDWAPSREAAVMAYHEVKHVDAKRLVEVTVSFMRYLPDWPSVIGESVEHVLDMHSWENVATSSDELMYSASTIEQDV